MTKNKCNKGKQCGETCIKRKYRCKPRPRSGGDPNCKKGKLCGKTCIKLKYNCKPKYKQNTEPRTAPPRAAAPARAAPPRAPPPCASAPPSSSECKKRTEILKSLPPCATAKELRKAYLKASTICHPDKPNGNVEGQQCLGWHYNSRLTTIGKFDRQQLGKKPNSCE